MKLIAKPIWLTLVFSILLSACTTNYKSYDRSADIKQLRAKLYQLENFHFSGKLGFRNDDEAFSVAVNNWKQTADNFSINLSSTFLGFGAVKLSGSANWIEVDDNDEEPIRSYYPNETLSELLGTPLPIQRIRYWLRGIPAPQSNADETLNKQGLITSMLQDGWKIDLDRYHDVNGLALPGRVKITQNQTRITLVVAQWSIL